MMKINKQKLNEEEFWSKLNASKTLFQEMEAVSYDKELYKLAWKKLWEFEVGWGGSEKYEMLLTRLQNMGKLTDEELELLSKDTDKEIRAEWGYISRPFFKSDDLKNCIVEFCTKYCKNDKILENILRVMRETVSRCKEFDDRYYQFSITNIDHTNKRIKYLISLYIWQFP